MRTGIETLKVYSIKECQNNLNKTYVFGDNLMGYGTGGQAIIRYCPNAFGIPTKFKPDMTRDAFFYDNSNIKTIIKGRLDTLYYRYINGVTLVFPQDGLGTGRAKLKEKAPKIYELIDDFLKTNFELEIML